MPQDDTAFGLKETTVQQINSIFLRYPVIDKVLIYGSRAKGNYRKGSDIDLTIIGDLTYSQLNHIERLLDNLLLPYTIDLSIFNHIDNPDLVDHIHRVGLVFYARPKKVHL